MKFAIIGCNSEDAITFPHHTEVVTTPYGNARVIHATLPNGKEVDFLTRHSICLQEDAYETNFRANIFALYLCGVSPSWAPATIPSGWGAFAWCPISSTSRSSGKAPSAWSTGWSGTRAWTTCSMGA